MVADRHAVPAAPAAAQQPGQQRRAVPRRARRGGGLPVGGHPGDVRLVLLRGDVGRQAARQQHQPLAGIFHHPPGVRPAGDLPARPGLPAAVGVIPGVGRVVQHVLQRLPGGAPPFELSLRRAGVNPDRQLDLLGHQVAEHAVERSQPAEGAEDEADDVLRLLVGIEDDLAGRPAGVPDRQRDRELAALGLGQLARQHPLPDQVQFVFAHRPLQAQQQPALVRDRTDTQAPPPVRADQPPPAEPGMIPLTIPEIKRLLAALTTRLLPRWLVIHWDAWTRRHQARSRWFHKRARLARDAEITLVN